jgi:hypothetical protein
MVGPAAGRSGSGTRPAHCLPAGVEELKYKELLAAYHTSDVFFRENLKGFNYGQYEANGYQFTV